MQVARSGDDPDQPSPAKAISVWSSLSGELSSCQGIKLSGVYPEVCGVQRAIRQ